MASIPMVDLKAQHQAVADEVAAGFRRVLDHCRFILGAEVKEFEDAYARFSGVGHCIGVANGTDALELCLRALGIGPGDEVIVPANTFIATPLAVARAGARPVLVDCDPEALLIDPRRVAEKIGPRTRAVIPVHLFGQMAPMEEITEALAGKSIALIEDAAQAQGARRNGTPAGAVGVLAGTSFYPGKNLGAYGDAGAVLTRSAELAAKVRALRNYGSEVKYQHPETGFNSRLDTLQAVVLGAKLKHLAQWNASRRAAAARYDQLLAERLPQVERTRTLEGNEHIFHLYVIRVPRRDTVLASLHRDGIGAGIHYPVPVHLQGAFAFLGHQGGDFPVAERSAQEMISLPLYPEITTEQQERVVGALARALG
jgi:dTDP-4-amino-4,6-dideoxygalactose transaminase